VGLERGPLSLASTTEELLERKYSGFGLEIRKYGRRDFTDSRCRSRHHFHTIRNLLLVAFLLGLLSDLKMEALLSHGNISELLADYKMLNPYHGKWRGIIMQLIRARQGKNRI
jgi:hypothetical protein